jgi:NADH-quinone oxidoreductase subunit F
VPESQSQGQPQYQYRLLPSPQELPRVSVEAYRQRGGYTALQRAVGSMTSAQVIGEVRDSGLRGRGGAGVLTAEKLALVARSAGDQRYVVCNAYDADARSAISRTLLARDPHRVIEGIALAAYAVGASEAYLFMRGASGAPEATAAAQQALRDAQDQHVLGASVLGSRTALTLTLVGVDLGFMAGEESTMLEIIKGQRAMPKQRPPYPTQHGLYDRPTAILNAETAANLPEIINRGGAAFKAIGAAGDPGTKLLTVIGPGAETGVLVEVPTGTPLAGALRQAGINATPENARAVVMGGLEGGALPLSQLNTALEYDALDAAGAIMGSSILEVLPANTCMVNWAMERSVALSRESCGKCVPCRVGVKRIAGTLEGIVSDLGSKDDLTLLDEFSHYVPDGSLCGFGIHAVHPVVSAMKLFPDDFAAHLEGKCPTGTCLPVRAHRYATKHVLP